MKTASLGSSLLTYWWMELSAFCVQK